jgi:hypothetical protein
MIEFAAYPPPMDVSKSRVTAVFFMAAFLSDVK